MPLCLCGKAALLDNLNQISYIYLITDSAYVLKQKRSDLMSKRKDDQRFWQTMKVVNDTWNYSMKNVRAFFIGVKDGEDGRERALKGSDNPEREMNFELGVALGPQIKEAGDTIFRALIKASVAAALGAIKGIK